MWKPSVDAEQLSRGMWTQILNVENHKGFMKFWGFSSRAQSWSFTQSRFTAIHKTYEALEEIFEKISHRVRRALQLWWWGKQQIRTRLSQPGGGSGSAGISHIHLENDLKKEKHALHLAHLVQQISLSQPQFCHRWWVNLYKPTLHLKKKIICAHFHLLCCLFLGNFGLDRLEYSSKQKQ